MGKKRIIKKKEGGIDQGLKARSMSRLPKRKLSQGVFYVTATYNNTMVSLMDVEGGLVIWSSSGSLGFKGAKKGTPYAASKVAEIVVDKAKMIGLKDAEVIVKGVGTGRDSAIRTIANKGVVISVIRDVTPIPHNGPRRKKPRRV